MDDRDLAAELAVWLPKTLDPTDVVHWDVLLLLVDLGVSVHLERVPLKWSEGRYYFRAQLGWNGKTSDIPLSTWEEVFDHHRQRGHPFIVVRPDYEGEPMWLPLGFDPAQDPGNNSALLDEDGEGQAPYLLVGSLEDIPLVERAVYGHIRDDEEDRAAKYVYAASIASAACKLILGHDPGRRKYQLENQFFACVDALNQFARGSS